MAERKYFKAINFDLDTKALKRIYPKKNTHQAYRDIQFFMERNGFKHRQWSGYHSIAKLSDSELADFMDGLYGKFPWLEQCVSRLDATNIGRYYDLMLLHQEHSAEAPIQDDLEQKSIHTRMAEAKAEADRRNNDRSLEAPAKKEPRR